MRKDTRAALQRLSVTGRAPSQPVFQDPIWDKPPTPVQVVVQDYADLELRVLQMECAVLTHLYYHRIFCCSREEKNHGN